MSKKVLVADDEAHILHVVSMKLQRAGYEVITAMDGEEALELCVPRQIRFRRQSSQPRGAQGRSAMERF